MKRLLIPVLGLCLLQGCTMLSRRDVPVQPAALATRYFTAPTSPAEMHYLGVGGPFALSEINAEVVILEIFSCYCPYCQSWAPRANEFYAELLQAGYGERIEMLAVDAENGAMAVQLFRDQYNIAFPIVTASSFNIIKAFGVTAYPQYVVVNLRANPPQVIYNQPGKFGRNKTFLDMIVERAGL